YCNRIQQTLDISDSLFLKQHPSHLLHLFVLFADNDDILFFSANSLRLIREFAQSLPREKLYTPQGRRYFIEIISRYRGVFKALSLMHRLGLLSLYLPEMMPLAGQMQYDLYHLYTVDAHTLFVLRNCECLFEKNSLHNFPLVFSAIDAISSPNLLFLAGLLHDIGKGQGGDHSGKGAIIAKQFCLEHGLTTENAEIVAWLVNDHLLMSEIAQHQDIWDTTVIARFCATVKTLDRLHFLYLLTIADIYATNASLWNHWRSALLRDLYLSTKQSLAIELSDLPKSDTASKQAAALAQLTQDKHLDPQFIHALWEKFGNHYFQLESISHIAWHT
ncbi:MAG TPA: HD domain-containing protein, partial [Candidatus Berkiella sp.]|nr:HD domain-containing protein [Candidatus Berkiella sp.]